jgi:hypothetical protein
MGGPVAVLLPPRLNPPPPGGRRRADAAGQETRESDRALILEFQLIKSIPRVLGGDVSAALPLSRPEEEGMAALFTSQANWSRFDSKDERSQKGCNALVA